MLWVGILLMIMGQCIGLYAIGKATKQSSSATKLGLLCYGGIFIALVGSVLVGKVL